MKPPKAETQETPNRSKEQESKPAQEQHGKLSQQWQVRRAGKGAHTFQIRNSELTSAGSMPLPLIA
jgi:hypothetical protein